MRTHFSIDCGGDELTVDGVALRCVPGLAITRCAGVRPTRLWTLTHIGSGRSLTSVYFASLVRAMRFALRLRVVDWTRTLRGIDYDFTHYATAVQAAIAEEPHFFEYTAKETS